MYELLAMLIAHLVPGPAQRREKALRVLGPLEDNVWSLLLVKAKEPPVQPQACLFQPAGGGLNPVTFEYLHAFAFYLFVRVFVTDDHLFYLFSNQP
jgi:hypothetical protein